MVIVLICFMPFWTLTDLTTYTNKQSIRKYGKTHNRNVVEELKVRKGSEAI